MKGKACQTAQAEGQIGFNSSVVKSLCIDAMVSGSNSPSAKFPRRVRRVASSLNSRRVNHKVWSQREEGHTDNC